MPLTLSDVLGYASILSWLFAQFPQLITNWQLQSAEGLALPFLVNWLFGDLTNLVGCILTHQLPFQTYLALYFTFVDVCLLGQYAYYTPFSRFFLPPPTQLPSTPGYGYSSLPRSASRSVAPRTRSKSVGMEIERGLRRLSLLSERAEEEAVLLETEELHQSGVASAGGGHRADRSASKHRNSNVGVRKAGMVFLAIGGLFQVGYLSTPRTTDAAPVGQVLGDYDVDSVFSPSTMVNASASLSTPTMHQLSFAPDKDTDTERIIGRISAWTCTTLYLTSRLPQIWKNFVRKSVEGLSMSLFIFAFLGNLLYVLSILASPNAHGPGARAFLIESIPYLLGSGGVLLFDVTIVLQGRIYKDRPPLDYLDGREDRLDEEEDSRGRSRERRASAPEEEDGLLGSTEPMGTYNTVGPAGERPG